MAIYHCSVKIIGRSSGRSSVASSAYRSGEKLYNERDGLIHDYTRKTGIIHSEILIPVNAPSWAEYRQELWNEVEKSEKRKDSQLVREIEVALPNELNLESRIELVREYVKENFVNKGMIADISIHDKEDGNPHSHIMVTTRSIDQDGFGKKEREWNKKEYLEKWRESWADHSNRYLEKEGYEDRIDHRSYKRQGVEKIPTIHVGVSASAMEKRGIETDRGNVNREVLKQNEYLKVLSKEVEDYSLEISELKEINENKIELKVDVDKKEEYYNNHIISKKLSKEIKTIILELENKQTDNSTIIEEIYNKRSVINNIDSRISELNEERENTAFFEIRKRKDISRKIEELDNRREELYSSLETEYDIQDMYQLENFVENVLTSNETLSDNIKQCDKDLSASNYLIDAYKEKYIFAAIKEYQIENYISVKREYKDDEQTNLDDLNFEKLRKKYSINKHRRVSLDELFEMIDDKKEINMITPEDLDKLESKLNDNEKAILLSIIKKDSSGDKNKDRETNILEEQTQPQEIDRISLDQLSKEMDKKKKAQEQALKYKKMKQMEYER